MLADEIIDDAYRPRIPASVDRWTRVAIRLVNEPADPSRQGGRFCALAAANEETTLLLPTKSSEDGQPFWSRIDGFVMKSDNHIEEASWEAAIPLDIRTVSHTSLLSVLKIHDYSDRLGGMGSIVLNPELMATAKRRLFLPGLSLKIAQAALAHNPAGAEASQAWAIAAAWALAYPASPGIGLQGSGRYPAACAQLCRSLIDHINQGLAPDDWKTSLATDAQWEATPLFAVSAYLRGRNLDAKLVAAPGPMKARL